MKIYKCPKCQAKYLEVVLLRTKCSENTIGFYYIEYCPKCLNKKRPELVKLYEDKNAWDELIKESKRKKDNQCVKLN